MQATAEGSVKFTKCRCCTDNSELRLLLAQEQITSIRDFSHALDHYSDMVTCQHRAICAELINATQPTLSFTSSSNIAGWHIRNFSPVAALFCEKQSADSCHSSCPRWGWALACKACSASFCLTGVCTRTRLLARLSSQPTRPPASVPQRGAAMLFSQYSLVAVAPHAVNIIIALLCHL